MPKYGIGRTRDGSFYLIETDERGNSHEIYSDGKLVKFDSSEEAKESIREAGYMEESEALPTKPTKKWRTK